MFAPDDLPDWLSVSVLISVSISVSIAAVLIAMLLDHLFGEPPVRFHPVVWMGNYLSWAQKRFAPRVNQPSSQKKPASLTFSLGAAYWIAGAGFALVLGFVIAQALQQAPLWVEVVFLGALLKPMLSWRMLRREVHAVEIALNSSLHAGRTQLARLVSRDVADLTEVQIREAAIETLAENLNDSVVAPIFWFLILGLPGAILYRFSNTADAMWGYTGPRGDYDWRYAGKWAARADDVMSWLPARLTAVLILLFYVPGFKSIWREADKTPSPNSGWPMAAMALILNVRLSKPGVYCIHEQGQPSRAPDLNKAQQFAAGAIWVLLTLLFLLLLFLWVANYQGGFA